MENTTRWQRCRVTGTPIIASGTAKINSSCKVKHTHTPHDSAIPLLSTYPTEAKTGTQMFIALTVITLKYNHSKE